MRVATGWDHHGSQFREKVRTALEELGHEMVDMGAQTDEPSDYPDFAVRVSEAVARGEAERGLLICGTGVGMAIAANKVRGVRAATVHDEKTAYYSRLHNNANVLCLGEDTAAGPLFQRVVEIWLATDFERGGRHERRVSKMMQYELEQHDG